MSASAELEAGRPRRLSVVREGTIAGLLGAASVAVWFFVIDLLRGTPLRVPSALGHLLFHATGTAGTEGTTAHVVAYTIFHFVAFVVVGVLAAAVLRKSEQEPSILAGAVLLFLIFEGGFYIITSLLAQSKSLGLPAWYMVATGNVIASVVMGTYLWRAYPSLRSGLETALGGKEH